jgi:2-polyprenyl-3-methyl-5-hydroxy-6-metoxy-1,4-benzoquinol methylase
MTPDQHTAPFDWFANQLTAARREEFIETIYPHMRATLKVGDRVVDLGCGAGSNTLFLEEQGAHITGIDLSPGLIVLAREEAAQRGAAQRERKSAS